jgi:hypothetical protein
MKMSGKKGGCIDVSAISDSDVRLQEQKPSEEHRHVICLVCGCRWMGQESAN